MPFTALNAVRMSFAENHFLSISKLKGPIHGKKKKRGGAITIKFTESLIWNSYNKNYK